jgi:hypothetical protein
MEFVASIPANLDIPSFLDLPAEIRNWIYGFYFHHPDPLYLADTGNDSVTLLRRMADGNHVLKMCCPRAPKKNPTTSRWDTTCTRPLMASAYQPELSLFLVCRQIHQEAASMLYSNEFCVLRKFDAHPTYHDTTGHYINQTPTSWLRQIGQHKSFVRKLCIDLGSICPVDRKVIRQAEPQTFRPHDGYLQFGALLQAVWASDRQMAVTFIDPQPHSYCHIEPDPRHAPTLTYDYTTPHTRSTRNVGRLNQTFQLLCNDGLGMRKFRRAILDLGIKVDGSGGVFVFWTPTTEDLRQSMYIEERNPLLDHARYFRNEEGGTLQFITPTSTRMLDLPISMLTRIMKHTLQLREVHEVDLDSFSDLKESCGILYSNKSLHDKYIRTFLLNTFDLSMMTTDAHANFEFDKLERLLQTNFEYRGDISKRVSCLQFGTNVDYSVTMHIYSGTSTQISSLKEVRINIMPLLAATFAADPRRTVKILLHTGNALVKSHLTSIQQLRQEALKAIEQYVKKDHRTDFRVQCPEVWINGHGKITDVISTGSLEHPDWKDPAKTNRALWSASRTGYMGAEPDFVPNVKDLARSMYLYLKWINSEHNRCR